MPLLDHFHAPLSRQRQWESFHSAWAEAIAKQLNEGLLPDRYYAEVHVKLGRRIEIDVGTFEETNGAGRPAEQGGVAVWRRRSRQPRPRWRSRIPICLRFRC